MQYLSVLSVWDRQTGRWRVVIAHSYQKNQRWKCTWRLTHTPCHFSEFLIVIFLVWSSRQLLVSFWHTLNQSWTWVRSIHGSGWVGLGHKFLLLERVGLCRVQRQKCLINIQFTRKQPIDY